MKIRLFYFVADYFPAWRSDVAELFGRELPKRGLSVDWSMRRAEVGFFGHASQLDQLVLLPTSLGRRSALARVGNRVLEAVWEAFLFLRLLISRYDIIQVRDDRYLAAFWALAAARLTGAKFIYWLSFPFPENDAEMAKRAGGIRRHLLRWRARIAAWWLYRVVLPKADHVFVQSEQMRLDIQAYGLSADRMTPVPMAVPQRLLDWMRTARRVTEPGLIVYIGTLAASRRLEMLIDALGIVRQSHPQARLAIVGDGDVPGERQALEARADSRGLGDSCRFTGFLPMEDAWRIAASAEIGVSPFYPDRVFNVASPTKLIESMALGVPPVANRQPEQSAVLAASGAGLCVEWGAQEFASAICWLLDHPDEARTMGEKGVQWVAAHRTYPIVAARVWEVYRTVLGEKP